MGDSASPLMLRRRLRTELRTARLKKELTQEQVAKAMDWSLSKMNRIEKAKTGISTNDLKALLPLYGITDQERTEELLALAREARQSPVVAAVQRRRADHGPRTDRLRIRGVRHQPIRADVRAWHSADRGVRVGPSCGPSTVRTPRPSACPRWSNSGPGAGTCWRARMRRSSPSCSTRPSSTAWAGSPAVTSQQLRHLVELADLPNVTHSGRALRGWLSSRDEGAFQGHRVRRLRPTKTSYSSKVHAKISSVTIPKKPRVTWRPSGASRSWRSRHRILSTSCARRQMR